MKKVYITTIIFVAAAVVFSFFYFKTNSLNSKLDELEKIIVKYEPKFDSIPYGSQEYSDMIVGYNNEIYKWAEVFENNRYQRDEDGRILYDNSKKPLLNKEFNQDVEKRFYELNDRMTRMVLAKMPKQDIPQSQQKESSETQSNQ